MLESHLIAIGGLGHPGGVLLQVLPYKETSRADSCNPQTLICQAVGKDGVASVPGEGMIPFRHMLLFIAAMQPLASGSE